MSVLFLSLRLPVLPDSPCATVFRGGKCGKTGDLPFNIGNYYSHKINMIYLSKSLKGIEGISSEVLFPIQLHSLGKALTQYLLI